MYHAVRRCLPVALLAALFAAWSIPGFAQSDSAQISGYVKDSTDAVIPGATVTLTNETTGFVRSAQTNATGYYVVPNMPPGFYTITVELAGFKKFVKTQNKLDPNIATTIDATMEIGAVSETVEVVASAVTLQSETATVGKLVESSQIKNMMLNGRNPLFLALLKPGVRGGSLAGFSFGLTNGGLAINGARTQDSVIAFDGAVNVRTRANGTSIGTPDLETVQEMQILTANYNAEYGRSSGGQIRFVTKSGGTQFHGSFYEYFRNEHLDSNSWSRNRTGQQRPANKFNQFGYILSGPVTIPGKFNTDRSKLFWLWGQEWVRYRQGATTIITVPSLAMRQGDFSELLNASNPYFGKVRTVNDPSTGQAFANNVIPKGQLSSNGIGMLNASPEPTPGFLQGRANFIQTRPQPADQRKDTVSLDFNPTEKHAFRFRFQNYTYFDWEAFRGGTDRATRTIDRPNKTVTLNHIWTVDPTMVNELLLSASVDRVYLTVPNEQGLANRSRYGIDYPYIFPERKEIFDKIPTIDISNFQTIDGGPYPSSSTGPIYQISNNLTKIHGNHTLKVGFRFERAGQNDFDQINVSGVPGGTNNQNGRFVFDDTRSGAPTTGVAIANAALGLFTSYAEIGPRAFTPYRGQMYEWFAQDSWKVTPKLRLEIGVRHTMEQPYFYSLWRNMAVFDTNSYDPSKRVVQDPATGNILSGDPYNGVVIPGTGFPDAARGRVAIADSGQFDRLFNGGDKTWGKFQWLNFQPRIGLAYRLDNKTVLRSGVGSYYSRPGVSDNIFLGGNPPFQPMVSIANGSADDPSSGGRTAFPQFFMTSDPVFKIPSAWNWNFTVEREVGYNTTLEVAYVGRVGLHMERVRDINQLPVGTLQNPANKGINPNVLRPYGGFASINLGENAARSEYNGLQIGVNRRFSGGLSYGFAYTYSQSKDNAAQRRDQIFNNYDDRNFWGYSDFDSTHVAVINFIYEVPFFKDKSTLHGKLLGGWQVTGVTQFQTGTPILVGTGNDFAGIGSGNQTQPWDVHGDINLPRGDRAFSQSASDSNFFFRTTAADGSPLFTAPAAGTFSASQYRNSLNHNVGFQNWNLALFKDFAINERHGVQFRAEFFNFPNHPNWSNADTNPRSSTFGKVTQKTSERNVQLSLRYSF